tara:strand:- start:337 stop:495 length:159 start_codon:yes stop_codon:yes gene_type:complete
MNNNKKMYLVLSTDKNYVQGAFPLNEEGKKKALAYQKKLKREKKIDTYIIEK